METKTLSEIRPRRIHPRYCCDRSGHTLPPFYYNGDSSHIYALLCRLGVRCCRHLTLLLPSPSWHLSLPLSPRLLLLKHLGGGPMIVIKRKIRAWMSEKTPSLPSLLEECDMLALT